MCPHCFAHFIAIILISLHLKFVICISFKTTVPRSFRDFQEKHDSGCFPLNDSHRSKSWRVLVESVHCTGLAVLLTKPVGGDATEQGSALNSPSVHVIPNYIHGDPHSVEPSPNWAVALSCGLHEAEFDVDLLQEIHLTSNYNKLVQQTICQQAVTGDSGAASDVLENMSSFRQPPADFSRSDSNETSILRIFLAA